jgi:hypothetical protein
MLREELRDVLILLSVVRDRMPGRAKYQVLKYLQMGVIDFDHLEDEDMRTLARYFLRARRIEEEIRRLEEVPAQVRNTCGGSCLGTRDASLTGRRGDAHLRFGPPARGSLRSPRQGGQRA